MNELTIHTPAVYDALELSNLAPSTKIKYRRTWENALAAGVDLTDPDAIIEYASALSVTGRRYLSAMMKIQLDTLERRIKGSVDPSRVDAGDAAQIQALLWNIEALRSARSEISADEPEGKTVHIWLTQQQVEQITAMPFRATQKDLKAHRDYIVLAVLLGAGLRRKEMSELTFDALRQVPHAGEIRDVLQIWGKGAKNRVVMISPTLASHIREWERITGGGQIARSIHKSGKLGDSLSEFGIFEIVREYGGLIGVPELAAHDCRRSYGRLIYEETGGDIMFVKNILGHESVKTTTRYIGLDLDLAVDPRNFVIRERMDYFMNVSGD